MSEYQAKIDRAAEVFAEIETLAGGLTDKQGQRLDVLLDELQVFLDECAVDPKLGLAGAELRQGIRRYFGNSFPEEQ